MLTTPVVTLSPVSGSFPFPTKRISLASGYRTVLGSTEGISVGIQQAARTPTTSNGWFPARATGDITIPTISPLSLSSSHAEIWCEGGRVHVKVYIRDLSSAFGTFVNGLKISTVTALKVGDFVSLGSRIPRSDKTPAYITDLHLTPVIMRISLENASA